MNTHMVRRAPDGKLLAGSVLNPGGRPRAAIQEVREILEEHKEKFIDTLFELMGSDDEWVKLAALKEGFDRMLGRAPMSVDTTSTKTVEQRIQQLYLAAVIEANSRPDPRTVEASAVTDVTPEPDAGNSSIEW
jgi:hypothetical protein